MSHLGVPRLAQFDRKKGASRQGGAVFGMAECSGCLRVYPVLNCLFPLWVRSLPYWFILFFFFPLPPTQSKGRAGLHMPNRFIK